MSTEGLLSRLLSEQYQRDFAKLVVGELISYIGDQIALVALLLLTYQQTGNGSAVSGVFIFLQVAPLLIFGPIGGLLADRLPRRELMIAMDLLRALVSVLLVWTSNLFVLYVLVFLLGIGRAMFSPALRALMSQFIPGEHLARSNGIYTTTFNASLFLGPVLGGIVVAAWGGRGAFLLNAFSFVASALCIWAMRFRSASVEDAANEDTAKKSATDAGDRFKLSTFARNVVQGLTIVWQRPSTRGVTLSLIAVVLAGGIGNVANVGLAERVFNAGSGGYGILLAGAGLGILGGGLYISLGPKLNPLTPWLARGTALMALAMAAVAISPLLLIAAGALFLEGLGNAFENVVYLTVLQTDVPVEQQGRAFGGLYTFSSIANTVSLVLGGLLLDWIPIRAIYILTAVIMAGAVVVAWTSVASPFSTRAGETVKAE